MENRSIAWLFTCLARNFSMFASLTVFCLSGCRVTSLSMSPVDDTFISGSLDKTSRLWDLRSPNCQVSRRSVRCPLMWEWPTRVPLSSALCSALRASCTFRGNQCAPSIRRASSLLLGSIPRWSNFMTWGRSIRWEAEKSQRGSSRCSQLSPAEFQSQEFRMRIGDLISTLYELNSFF